jgi:cytochrome c556
MLVENSAFSSDERWTVHLAGLRAAATASADAAERKDYDALEKAGNDLNDQCVSCHLTFAPDLERQPEP